MSRPIVRFQKTGSEKYSSAKTPTGSSLIRRSHAQNGYSDTVNYMLYLQRTIGNRAVGQLLRSGYLQPKLHIGLTNDTYIYEQEAGRIAEQGMRTPQPRVQRLVAPDEEKVEPTIQTKPVATAITPSIQRQTEPEKEEGSESVPTRDAGELAEKDEEEAAHLSGMPDSGTGTPSRRACLRDVKFKFYDKTGTGCDVKVRIQFLGFRCVAVCNKRQLLNEISSVGAKICRQFCEKKKCYRLSFLPPKTCGLYTCDNKNVHCLERACPIFNECFYEPKDYYNCHCVAPRKFPSVSRF